MTAAVAALAAIVRANALLEVARFNPFTPDNHPYCGHDPPPFARGFREFASALSVWLAQSRNSRQPQRTKTAPMAAATKRTIIPADRATIAAM